MLHVFPNINDKIASKILENTANDTYKSAACLYTYPQVSTIYFKTNCLNFACKASA